MIGAFIGGLDDLRVLGHAYVWAVGDFEPRAVTLLFRLERLGAALRIVLDPETPDSEWQQRAGYARALGELIEEAAVECCGIVDPMWR